MVSRPALPPMAMLVFLGLLFTSTGFAGGSISWDQVEAELSRDDPFLATFIAAHFEVRHVGGALRVGHDSHGNSMVPGLGVGNRLPPYEFYAKPKGAGGDYTLYFKLEPSGIEDGKNMLWTLTIRKKRDSD